MKKRVLALLTIWAFFMQLFPTALATSYTARIEEFYYLSLADAVAVVTFGQTITLLADHSGTGISPSTAFFIDTNGYAPPAIASDVENYGLYPTEEDSPGDYIVNGIAYSYVGSSSGATRTYVSGTLEEVTSNSSAWHATDEILTSYSYYGTQLSGDYILQGDVVLGIQNASTRSIHVNQTINLDLNGYTISQTQATGASLAAIYVDNGGDLSIYDSSPDESGQVVGQKYAARTYGGDLSLYGGTLTTSETYSSYDAATTAAVWMLWDSNFYMYGGTISISERTSNWLLNTHYYDGSEDECQEEIYFYGGTVENSDTISFGNGSVDVQILGDTTFADGLNIAAIDSYTAYDTYTDPVVIVQEGATLIIPADADLAIEGELINYGTILLEDGDIISEGTVTNYGTITLETGTFQNEGIVTNNGFIELEDGEILGDGILEGGGSVVDIEEIFSSVGTVELKVTDHDDASYRVTIEWGSLDFEFDQGGAVWNTYTHTYEEGEPAQWVSEGYLAEEGDTAGNNMIVVTNHSNRAIDAVFDYIPDADIGIVGNFFTTPEDAQEAALVVDLEKNSVANALIGGTVSLHNASGYYTETGDYVQWVDGEEVDLGFAVNIYFALSGTPDLGAIADYEDFNRIGIVEITFRERTNLSDFEYDKSEEDDDDSS